MKFLIDGDQMCFIREDFTNLQESPAVFYPLDSEIAKTVLKGGILSLSLGDIWEISSKLNEEAS